MGFKETRLGKKFILTYQNEHIGSRLFRNNTGAGWLGKPVPTKLRGVMKIVGARLVRFGIGIPVKNRRGQEQPQGGGDYIGYTRKYCCEMFGFCPNFIRRCSKSDAVVIKDGVTFYDCHETRECKHFTAVFTSLEVKTGKQKRSPHQEMFSEIVKSAGGISLLAEEGSINAKPKT